jgi:transcriptional regulator with XRE-family HTH domain
VDGRTATPGERIREIRSRRGWSQAELAFRARIAERQIGRWERDENVPRIVALRTLAAALEVDLGVLLDDGTPVEAVA